MKRSASILCLLLVSVMLLCAPVLASAASTVVWSEDFENEAWRTSWPIFYPGGEVSWIANNTLNQTHSLLLTDNVSADGPVYLGRDFTLPTGATAAIVRMSLKVHSYTNDYVHGPHIFLADATGSTDPTGWPHIFVNYITCQCNQGYLSWRYGNTYDNTGLALNVGTWYDLEVTGDLVTGETRLRAKESSASQWTDYGVHAKYPETTGTFNRLVLGTGLSWSTGAATEFDNISVEVVTPPTVKELLNELSNKVIALNLQHGIANSLDKKLQNALDALDKMNEGTTTSVLEKLTGFVGEVTAQSGNKIPVDEANKLIAAANAIIAKLP